jgi:hypothetical protein
MQAEQFGNDLRIAPAESAGEIGARERLIQFLGEHAPRLKMQLGGIDERAIDVP